MSTHMLQRVLPLLRDAHDCIAGLPFDGTIDGLRTELALAVVKVDKALRGRAAERPDSAEDDFASHVALETLAAMKNGGMPFDQQRHDAARAYLVGSFRRAIKAPDAATEAPRRRASKH